MYVWRTVSALKRNEGDGDYEALLALRAAKDLENKMQIPYHCPKN